MTDFRKTLEYQIPWKSG